MHYSGAECSAFLDDLFLVELRRERFDAHLIANFGED
jgi:hypothetical protein